MHIFQQKIKNFLNGSDIKTYPQIKNVDKERGLKITILCWKTRWYKHVLDSWIFFSWKKIYFTRRIKELTFNLFGIWLLKHLNRFSILFVNYGNYLIDWQFAKLFSSNSYLINVLCKIFSTGSNINVKKKGKNLTFQ